MIATWGTGLYLRVVTDRLSVGGFAWILEVRHLIVPGRYDVDPRVRSRWVEQILTQLVTCSVKTRGTADYWVSAGRRSNFMSLQVMMKQGSFKGPLMIISFMITYLTLLMWLLKKHLRLEIRKCSFDCSHQSQGWSGHRNPSDRLDRRGVIESRGVCRVEVR